MEAFREVTQWNSKTQYNHIYLFDGDKAVAYIKWGNSQPEFFKNPLRIDRRGRNFVKSDASLFNVKTKSNLIEITGSRGNSYFVDPAAKTCTCPGFTFRRTCKHVAAYK